MAPLVPQFRGAKMGPTRGQFSGVADTGRFWSVCEPSTVVDGSSVRLKPPSELSRGLLRCNGSDLGNASSNLKGHEDTSTHVEDADEVMTASTRAAARIPSAKVGNPSGADPTIVL
jgi:hypothetical protein